MVSVPAPLMSRAHGVQEVGQVHNVGLLGGVFDDGGALGQRGGQHDVHGGAHGDHVQIDVAPGRRPPLGDGDDSRSASVTSAPMAREALDMLVDGPDAEVAAAGHGHGGLAEAAQQRAQQVVAGADAAHQVKGRGGGVDMAAVDLHRVAVQHPDIGPQLLQNRKTAALRR